MAKMRRRKERIWQDLINIKSVKENTLHTLPMPTTRQLITALKIVDDAIQNPLIREDLIQSAEVAQMGNVMDMIEQSILVEQIRLLPKRTK